jgi:uncharacterized membrane protein
MYTNPRTTITKLFATIIVLAVSLISFSGCYYDKAELLYPNSNATIDCGLITSKFTADIQPIIQQKCATSGCHDSNSAAGGSVLLTYSQISSAKDRIMVRAITDKTMPPSGALSIDEISKIKCWITAGALNN